MTLEQIRLRGSFFVAALAGLMTVVAVGAEWLFQGALGSGSLLACVGLGFLLTTYLAARQSPAFRYLAVAVMMGEVVALLIAARGLPFQTDIHMAFFAALAVCALLYDFKAILLGLPSLQSIILPLGMSLDELVFYGGGGLSRVMLHAVILVIEAAGLVWMTLNTRRLLVIADQRSEQAQASAQQAQELTEEVQQSSILRRDERAQTMEQLSSDFGRVVDAAVHGDFSARIEAQFDDEALNNLARSINTLVSTTGESIGETGRVLSQLAASDLTARMDGKYEGAFATLRNDINTLAHQLETMMGSLRSSVGTLRFATSEFLSGPMTFLIARRGRPPPSSRPLPPCRNLPRLFWKNAERAQEASVNASGVSKNAEEGGSAMVQATGAMDKIKASSANISNIIGLIDDIAFQTNLLA